MMNKKNAYRSIKTPIDDFLKKYNRQNAVRLHMPGHKGKGEFNRYDITEIDGADSLYHASGIIAESEKIAGEIFGAHTFYSTEGSSHCIRAMARLICEYAYSKGKKPVIWAARNAHKAFITAIALTGSEVKWLISENAENYLSCKVSAEKLDALFASSELPTAIYITSPDYLGNIADIKGISKVCKKYGVVLAVDNAHGAYLKFLSPSAHPIDLGADICCDSAHKTLPALTGSAYLHVSKSAPEIFIEGAKNALALFGSTSPSYLILRSLDRLNLTLSNGYQTKLIEFCSKLKSFKDSLCEYGYKLIGDEELKITVDCKAYGYTGDVFATIMRLVDIVPEYYDDDLVVMMFTPEISGKTIKKLERFFKSIPKRKAIIDLYPDFSLPSTALSIDNAYKKPSETISVDDAAGRICAEDEVACPPAVPIIVSGEIIDQNVILALKHYNVSKIKVVKN
ncbi:MAG: aminotransferase class V-fold PLP-dependent enzyme [Clostridia bacterium]|nr:aminotransferase class V-fold PLP-dependent enzyme [Clostridia bacterium]